MNLAIDYYPFLNFYHAGPKVFLNRLKNSIKKQNLCNVRSPYMPFFDIALFSVYEKNFFEKRFILRVDGIYFDKNNTAGDTNNLNNKIFNSISKANGVIYISKFSKDMVNKFYGKIDIPEKIIHNKVPLNYFKPNGDNYRKDLNIKNNERVLITSAHWRRHKRLEETIYFLNYLNSYSPIKYKLIILGGNKKRFNDENIISIGEVKPNLLSKWYRTADIYLHLAWIEPCGNTQIEAMASGIPVVCCNNGGIGETVIKAKGGIVVETDDQFEMNLIDYYNPPKPNYQNLKNAVEKIYDDYQDYKNKIDYDYLNIDLAAKEYCEFIKKCL